MDLKQISLLNIIYKSAGIKESRYKILDRFFKKIKFIYKTRLIPYPSWLVEQLLPQPWFEYLCKE